MEGEIRTYRDFLEIYNKMTENCFLCCVNTLGTRNATDDEKFCVEKCASKHIRVNHAIMRYYMQIQPEFMNKKMEEMNMMKQEQDQAALNDVTAATS